MNNYSTTLKKTLKIIDPNVKIEDYCEEVVKKGVTTLIYKGKLEYTPLHCKCCGSKNENYSIVKNGTRKTIIKMPKISECNVILELKKQRFYCKECEETFSADTTVVEKYCNISSNTKNSVSAVLKKVRNFTEIAEDYNVSPTTVIQINKNIANYSVNKNSLPEHMCFDEISTTGDIEGKMSFIFCDALNHKVIDIVESRQAYALITYFRQFPLSIRKKVKTIVIDMYKPYIKVIKEMFPNAKIIIDRFHIVQAINREFNKIRVAFQNRIRYSNSKLCTKVKNSWKLLLLDFNKLGIKPIYNKNFKQYLTQYEIIQYILSQDETLYKCYWAMQELREALRNNDYEAFYKVLENNKGLPKGFKRIFRTFNTLKPFINNTFNYPMFTNGPLEGINNKIKLIKRLSYGFRSFSNFRNRLIVIFNFLHNKKNKSIRQNVA